MGKKIGIIALVLVVLICIVSFLYFGKDNNRDTNVNENNNTSQNGNGNELDDGTTLENNDTNVSGDDNMSEFTNNIKLSINGEEYNVTLEDNETSRELVSRLPLSITMSEMNGNEKYYYFDESFPTNSSSVGRINAGDIMLYGDDCLVVFYESFNTSYSYTRIGKIDNPNGLENNVGNGNVSITFTS